MVDTNLKNDRKHIDICHQRWLERRNRKQESDDYRDAWYDQQCGRCVFFVPLTGTIGLDYGGCTNLESKFDGTIMFEHDGCNNHVDAVAWVEPPRVVDGARYKEE